MVDRYEKLDAATRWFMDGLSLAKEPGLYVMEDIDMTATKEVMKHLRQQNIKGTYTHIVVRAVALALSRHADLNRLILGKHLVYPDTINIGLSVSTDLSAAVTPTIILQNAGQKTLTQIAQEIITQASDVRNWGEKQRNTTLQKAARFLPAAWMRRGLLRIMKSRLDVIKKRTGTFHITCIPYLHLVVPLKFPTSAALAFSRVEERVVVIDGQPAVRPMASFSLVADHSLWNANKTAILLHEIKKILEEGELATELPLPEAIAGTLS